MQERKIIQQSRSFKDLDRTLKKLIKNKKAKLAGSIFEHLTKLFLEVSPEYKTKLRKVYLLNEIPTAVKRKLKLPNTDEGIDLIAETFDNEYWAIQCKYRSDKTETLKVKGDLATFNNLAFTVCKNISHGLIAATVNRPPQKKKLLNVGYILLNEWLKLDRDDGELFNQIKAKAIGKIVKPKKLSPRPHQREAISKTISYFKSNERGKMIMPCGTGKSLTAFWIAEKMKPKSILVAVPSLALLQQTLKVWTREFLLNNIEPDWLCVCSDDTVKEEQDDFVTFSADLGIKVDTDPRVIRNFLRKKTKKLKIVFTTYQSGRATAIGSRGFKYDLGIMDEAHKTVGSGKKPMAHLLHQKNIKINKRLFMTATERLFRGDSDEYMSMDDPRDYGNLIYELSFKEAINSVPPIISDYKIITFNISNPEIEEITNTNKYLEVKKELKDITARELATALALRKAIKEHNIKNAISFHRSIRRAENFRKQQDIISKVYPAFGKLKTFNVRGDMPTSDRALEMLSFEEEKGLMTNARCLTEGVDLPAIDCVCFTDPKRSKIDIVQAAGRALRLSKGKKFGFILIPIFINEETDFNTAAEQQGFDEVAITVRALANSDKRIVEYLKLVSEGKKPRGGSPVDGLISKNNLYKIDSEKFNNSVQLKIWDKVAIGNYRSYEDAIEWLKPFNLENQKQYAKLYQTHNSFPADIPKTPQRVYENFSWGRYLSSGFIATQKRKYRSYSEAHKFFVSKKNINSQPDFNKFKKNKNFPKDIPRNPNTTYEKDWKGWGMFLTGKKTLKNSDKKEIFVSYEKFRDVIINQKINTYKKFEKYKDSKDYPFNFPKAPDQSYKNKGWVNFPTLFGRPTFNEMVEILKPEKAIINKSQYSNFIKKKNKSVVYPYPLNPDMVYSEVFDKKGGWYYFLSISEKLLITKEQFILQKPKIIKVKNQKILKVSKPKKIIERYDKYFLNYNEAKEYIKRFKIKSTSEWDIFKKTNEFPKKLIPSSPSSYYENKGWISWPDFLSKKGFVAFHKRTYDSFERCKKYAKEKKIKSSREWRDHTRTEGFKKLNFPTKPQRTYKKKWKGWPDFLGK